MNQHIIYACGLLVGINLNGVIYAFLVTKYKLLNKSAVILSGFKYYKSENIGEQGPGSANYNADFEFYNNESGYLEISEKRKILDKTIIQFGFYVSSVDGEIDKKEGALQFVISLTEFINQHDDKVAETITNYVFRH